MKTLELQDATFKELVKLARPLIDDSDSLILKLVRHYKKEHTPNSVTGAKPVLQKTVNPDQLAQFIRPKFKGMRYGPACLKIIQSCGQSSLGIKSIVNLLFKFPEDDQQEDRRWRAQKSLMVMFRNGPYSKNFNEPVRAVFSLKLGLEG